MTSPLAILLLLPGPAACEVNRQMCCRRGAGEAATGSGAPSLLHVA